MAAPGIKVEGAKRLRRDLKRMGEDLDDLKAVNAAVAAFVAQAAQPRTPRRTGALASTLRGNRGVSRAVVMAGKARTPYPWFVHAGTVSQAAQPWISEAAQDTEPRWVAMYRAGVEQAAARVKGA